MVNKLMSKIKQELLEEIANSEEVIEFKRIEKLVLENKELSKRISDMFEAQKQAINAKELGLENTYFHYMKEYKEILSSFENDVLISSYLQSKEDVNNILKTVITIIERKISDKVNE